MITPDQARANIGRGVIYQASYHDTAEGGVITSANDTYVFVRFSTHGGGIACDPRDLDWLRSA